MKKFSKYFITLIVLLSSAPVYGGELIYAGIPEDTVKQLQIQQKQSNWCWATSIQMVLNLYGIDVTQEQIVDKTHGRDSMNRLFNATGTVKDITANLNHAGIDKAGMSYSVQSSGNWGAPTPSVLLHELTNGRPVIAGYQAGKKNAHAVVITGVWYEKSPKGPVIQYIETQDPYQTQIYAESPGRVTYPGSHFAKAMKAYWYVRVMRN